MPRPNLDQVRSLGDFATTIRWQLIFASFPAVGGLGLPLSEDLDLRCESIDVPKMTTNPMEVQIRGHKVYQAGISDFSGTFSITFVETTNNLIHNFIKGWRELIWSQRDGIAVEKDDYEATIILLRLNNQDEAVWQYKLEGCWLQDYELGQLDGSSTDAMKPQMTIQYDFFTDGPL